MKKPKLKIKKGDLVVVGVGKDRGKQGKVEKVFPKDGMLLVTGVNQYKKQRKSQGEGRPGEIATLTRPSLTSRVALICPKCKQPTRVGYRYQDAKKIRVCRKCGGDI